MTDWRTIETKLVRCFQAQGFKPEVQIGEKNPLAGDWTVGQLNISKLARDLSVELVLTK